MNEPDVGYVEQLKPFLVDFIDRNDCQASERSLYLPKILADTDTVPIFSVANADSLRSHDVHDMEDASRMHVPKIGRFFLEITHQSNREVLHVVDVSSKRNATFAAPVVRYGHTSMSKAGCFLITPFVGTSSGSRWRPRANAFLINKKFDYAPCEDIDDDDDDGGVLAISYQIATVAVFANSLRRLFKAPASVAHTDQKFGSGQIRNTVSFINAMSTPGVHMWRPEYLSGSLYDNYYWLVNNDNQFILGLS